MDMEKYQHQVAALRQYVGTPDVPPDPYDVSAGQAKQLLRDDQTIALTGRDKAT
jgi:hypothetical protein